MTLKPKDLIELMSSNTQQATEPYIPGYKFVRELNFEAEVVASDLEDGEICFEFFYSSSVMGVSPMVNTWTFPTTIMNQPGNQYYIFRRA